MGFRNDEDARIHRIDALEGALDEKDAEIARLKAQLEAKDVDDDRVELERMEAEERKDAAARAQQKQAPRTKIKQDTREVRTIDLHMPHLWMLGVAWIPVVAAVAWYMHAIQGMEWEALWPALLVLPVGLFFLHRHTLVLDKRSGTVTRLDQVLVFSWRRVRPYAGKAITIHRGYYSNEDGNSHWTGHVFLEDLKLFVKKEGQARRLAKEIAEFLDITYRTARPKQAQRHPMLPLVLTMVAVVIFLIVFLLREHLLQ